MTVRAIVIGLLVGLLLAGFGYFNDWVLKQAYVASDLVPVSVYGLLVLGLLLVNPVLRLIRRSDLSAREWVVIASMTLAACVIPGAGLMWNFSNTLVIPHKYYQLRPAWQKNDVLSFAPKIMLADPTAEGGPKDPKAGHVEVVDGFNVGLKGKEVFPPSEVPWYGWTRTLTFWLSLLALSFIAGIGLVLVVHKQWSQRERLRYPIALFASELVAGAGEGFWPRIFRNRLFWLGAATSGLVLMANALHVWKDVFEIEAIQIPMFLDLRSVLPRKWPLLWQAGPAKRALLVPSVYFAIVGLAYFVSSDVSFSIGISPLLHMAVWLVLITRGVQLTDDYLAGGMQGYQLFGSGLALGLMVIYLGRRFYASVAARAVGIRRGEPVDRSTLWAFRVALLSAAGMVAMLTLIVDLHWLLALGFVLLTGLVFLVVTRVSVETGLFFIQPNWHAVAILLALFGIKAIGPNMLIILALLSMVLTADPRVCLMPIVANAFRFGERQGASPRKLAWVMGLSVMAALVVGVLGTLYVQYIYGGGTLYGWASSASAYPFEMVLRNLPKFGEGAIGQWNDFQIGQTVANETFLWSAGVGFALVILMSVLRLRYTWWPLHPVIFVVWGTIGSTWMATSFFVGWVLKTVISRLGGGKAYAKAKPYFIGLVAGEFLVGIIWGAIGLIYYMIYGHPSGVRFIAHP